jgi:hypothetical protein
MNLALKTMKNCKHVFYSWALNNPPPPHFIMSNQVVLKKL